MENNETYSETIGMRLKPSMLHRLIAAAAIHNLPTAVFARWVLLNYLDKMPTAKK